MRIDVLASYLGAILIHRAVLGRKFRRNEVFARVCGTPCEFFTRMWLTRDLNRTTVSQIVAFMFKVHTLVKEREKKTLKTSHAETVIKMFKH